jgi:hypothetical protein
MRYILAFIIGFALMGVSMRVRAADLPIPHPRPMTVPIPDRPIAAPSEKCLKAGEEPSPGQTLHVDKSCKLGLRWIFAH